MYKRGNIYRMASGTCGVVGVCDDGGSSSTVKDRKVRLANFVSEDNCIIPAHIGANTCLWQGRNGGHPSERDTQ